MQHIPSPNLQLQQPGRLCQIAQTAAVMLTADEPSMCTVAAKVSQLVWQSVFQSSLALYDHKTELTKSWADKCSGSYYRYPKQP